MMTFARVVAGVCLGIFLAGRALAVEVGSQAPDFTKTPRWNGSLLATGHYIGKVIYLDFWASWCVPCRESFPVLNRLYRQYEKDGFVVIAVNLDEVPADAEQFLVRTPIDFFILRDTAGALATRYQLKAMPSSYIIDRTGKVASVHQGFRPENVASIEATIQKLLKNTPAKTLPGKE